MTKPDRMPRLHELRALEDTLREHRSTCRGDMRARALRLWWRMRRTARRPQVRKLAIGAGAALAVVMLGIRRPVAAAGSRPDRTQLPVALACLRGRAEYRPAPQGRDRRHPDRARQFRPHRHPHPRHAGARCRRRGGGERPQGRSLGLGLPSLLRGQVRAQRVSLVGAELSVRIEADGQVTMSTGAEKRPLAVTPAIVKAAPAMAAGQPGAAARPPAQRNAAAPRAAADPSGADRFVAFMAWLERISTLGLDGQGLGEIGLKDGMLRVDDLRTDKHWTFEHINFSVNKPGDGISVRLSFRRCGAAVEARRLDPEKRLPAQAGAHRSQPRQHQGPVSGDPHRRRTIPGRYSALRIDPCRNRAGFAAAAWSRASSMPIPA